jgi:HD-like signal output (HDOD) protein
MLGLDTVKNLAIALSSFNKLENSRSDDYSVQNILNYSLDIGKASKTYATVLGLNNSMIENASLAGMLHDIGKLIMIGLLPEEFDKSLNISKEKMISLYQAQRETIGLTDAEIGGYLLCLWGLPLNIVNAVTYHYSPSENENTNIDIITAVHLAYAIERDTNKYIPGIGESLDREYISRLKLENKIKELRSFAIASKA